MLKTRLILVVASIALILILYFLPKVVVESEDREIAEVPEGPAGATISSPIHSIEFSEEESVAIRSLRQTIEVSEFSEKTANFADSLAGLYQKANKLDSAAHYFGLAFEAEPVKERQLKAANAYFEAFTYAMDAEKTAALGLKARKLYEQVLEDNPDNLDARINMAMTFLSGPQPMDGIMMLRAVAEEHPGHEKANFNLGILAMQTGQYRQAIQRLEQATATNPENVQAQFYLGQCYLEVGSRDEARKRFEKVKELDENPETQAAADSYLNDIK